MNRSRPLRVERGLKPATTYWLKYLILNVVALFSPRSWCLKLSAPAARSTEEEVNLPIRPAPGWPRSRSPARAGINHRAQAGRVAAVGAVEVPNLTLVRRPRPSTSAPIATTHGRIVVVTRTAATNEFSAKLGQNGMSRHVASSKQRSRIVTDPRSVYLEPPVARPPLPFDGYFILCSAGRTGWRKSNSQEEAAAVLYKRAATIVIAHSRRVAALRSQGVRFAKTALNHLY